MKRFTLIQKLYAHVVLKVFVAWEGYTHVDFGVWRAHFEVPFAKKVILTFL